MPVTRRNGVLGQVQQQAQQIIRDVSSMQQLRQVAQRPQPMPAQRPVLQQVQQQGQQAVGQALQAVRQITQQAQAPRQMNPVLDQVRASALNALQLAQQPGRGPIAPGRNRLTIAANQAFLTPQQESQLFDQQIQITKAEAAQYTPMGYFEDPLQQARRDQLARMESGFLNPVVNPRIQLEGDLIRKMPDMDPRQLRGLSDQQLIEMNKLPYAEPFRYDPLSSALPGTPRPVTTSAVGTADTVASSGGVAPTMTKDAPKGPPPQPPYVITSGGNYTGTSAVTQAMNGAITQGNQTDDGGGFLDTARDIGGGLVEGAGDVIEAGGEFLGDGFGVLTGMSPGEAIDALKAAAAGKYEDFAASGPGGFFLDLMDAGLSHNKEEIGNSFYEDATGQAMWQTGKNSDGDDLRGPAFLDRLEMRPEDVIYWLAAEGGDKAELDKVIIDAYENGYSSPAYIEELEAAGVDPETAPPEFAPGGRAVWESVIGYATDDAPNYIKYPVRILVETVTDPLTFLPAVTKVGTLVKTLGGATRAVEGASTGAKALGGVMQGAGRAIELITKLPDLPVEAVVKGGGIITRRTGEVTGLLTRSMPGQRDDAITSMGAAAGAVESAGDSLPVGSAGRAFDAQAQGVTPTSGPELIATPGPAATPSRGAAAPSPATAAPGSVSAAPSPGRAVTTADDPRFRDYATADEAETAALSLYDDWRTAYGHTLPDDSLAREGAGMFALKDAGGEFSKTFKPGKMNITKRLWDSLPSGPDGFRILKNADGTWSINMSAETKAARAGTPLPPSAAPTATATATKTGPNLAELNRMISEFPGSALANGMTAKEGRAYMLGLRTMRNDMRAGRVPSDGVDTSPAAQAGAKAEQLAEVNRQIAEQQNIIETGTPAERSAATAKLAELHQERERLGGKTGGTKPTTQAERDAAAAAGSSTDTPRSTGAAETVNAAEAAAATKKFPTAPAGHGNLAKAINRAKRLAKEEREGLPKEVNKILAAQKYGEHEFSPIYGGNRPLDRIVTAAINSKDPAKLAKADKFVKEVDDAVQKHLRTDDFYKTWDKGGVPIHLQDDPRFTPEFFARMDVLEPGADPARLRVLANGVAKKSLDDLAQLGFRVNHLIPMLKKAYPEQFTLDAMLGSIGRIESRNFRDESAEYLMARYIDVPDMAESRTILKQFLTDPNEMTVIADGIHKPYAHSIPTAHQTEAAARLQKMRSKWWEIKRQAAVDGNFSSTPRFTGIDGGGHTRRVGSNLEITKKFASRRMERFMRTFIGTTCPPASGCI
jgi:hypothetical protein